MSNSNNVGSGSHRSPPETSVSSLVSFLGDSEYIAARSDALSLNSDQFFDPIADPVTTPRLPTEFTLSDSDEFDFNDGTKLLREYSPYAGDFPVSKSVSTGSGVLVPTPELKHAIPGDTGGFYDDIYNENGTNSYENDNERQDNQGIHEPRKLLPALDDIAENSSVAMGTHSSSNTLSIDPIHNHIPNSPDVNDFKTFQHSHNQLHVPLDNSSIDTLYKNAFAAQSKDSTIYNGNGHIDPVRVVRNHPLSQLRRSGNAIYNPPVLAGMPPVPYLPFGKEFHESTGNSRDPWGQKYASMTISVVLLLLGCCFPPLWLVIASGYVDSVIGTVDRRVKITALSLSTFVMIAIVVLVVVFSTVNT